MTALDVAASLPRALSAYPDQPGSSLFGVLTERVHLEPFNAIASVIFLLAIVHTFAAARFTKWGHQIQRAYDEDARGRLEVERPSVGAEILHFLGEIEVVFGLWAVVLLVAMAGYGGWDAARHYFNDTVNYTEALFVVVTMSVAATRPIIALAERALRRLASLGRATPAAWWVAILIAGPLLGSFITEPAAMTICAVLLGRQFYELKPSPQLKYATLGLLFVNVSIGGTLTHFAAPPVLMVARLWAWDLSFMLGHFAWRAVIAIVVATLVYLALFWREMAHLARRSSRPEIDEPDDPAQAPAGLLPVPPWLTLTHLSFMAWTVITAHYPALFVGGFLIFLGFVRATAAYQSRMELKTPLLVGFFLAGLVIHGGLQGWWIAPVLARLSELPLFLVSTLLTAFNDNALITYLATLVPNLDDPMKIAIVEGAVTGGGLTVIANAPNPAGQALLSRFFDEAVSPLWLLLGALVPTLIVLMAFRVL